jgi:hypothetical protein
MSGRDDYGKLLGDPRVLAFLTAKVDAYGLPHAQAEDIVSKTFEALWRQADKEDAPDNLARLLGLAGVVFEGKLNDYFRRKAVDEGRLVDARNVILGKAAEDAPASAHGQPNYVDRMATHFPRTPSTALAIHEKMAFVQGKVKEGVLTYDDIEVMEAQHAGEQTLDELAKERGMQPAALRQRLHRIRKKLIKAWAEFSLITKTTTIVFLILLLLVVVTIVAAALRRKEPPIPLPPPVPSESPLERAPPPPVREAPRNPKDDKSP